MHIKGHGLVDRPPAPGGNGTSVETGRCYYAGSGQALSVKRSLRRPSIILHYANSKDFPNTIRLLGFYTNCGVAHCGKLHLESCVTVQGSEETGRCADVSDGIAKGGVNGTVRMKEAIRSHKMQ